MESQERLLEKPADADSEAETCDESYNEHPVPRWPGKRPRIKFCKESIIILLLSVLLTVSLLGNVLLILRPQRRDEGRLPDIHVSPYSGLTNDQPTTFPFHTDYSSDNRTLRDELWDAIYLDHLVIAPKKEWAREKDLQPSMNFVWDSSRSAYFLRVFHHLHCLKAVHRAFSDFEAKNASIVGFPHVYHCLDMLRQDITCRADDTPTASTISVHGVGDGEVRQCKDWDKLMEWATAPEREGCYSQVNDYQRRNHTIENYAYCPEDSEHYPVMKSYFEEHGFFGVS